MDRERDANCEHGCGVGKSEGPHSAHVGMPCSWHDGTCEEANVNQALWCQCGRDDIAKQAWEKEHA